MEWSAVAVGLVGGWFGVSWVMGKIQELNARPSPLDAPKPPVPADENADPKSD
jgi:hypothetical protein